MAEQKNKTLKQRVKDCRNKLQKIGAKNPKNYFCLKYRMYSPTNVEKYNRLDNLWYGKIEDEDFTERLEAFTQFMKIQFT